MAEQEQVKEINISSVLELSEPEFAAYLAIDWADQKHVYALQAAGSQKCEMGELENRPEAVELWAAELGRRFQNRPIAVCLEQSRGALVCMLIKYAQFVLYPLHPAAVGRFRAAFYPSGAKDDPLDAALQLEILVKHRNHLRRLEPDTVETRLLQFLTEERRNLVDERTAHSNRLRSKLKWYFPQVPHWFSELDSALVGELLQSWPTLEQLQRARPETLRQFFHQHNCRKEELIQQRFGRDRKGHPGYARSGGDRQLCPGGAGGMCAARGLAPEHRQDGGADRKGRRRAPGFADLRGLAGRGPGPGSATDCRPGDSPRALRQRVRRPELRGHLAGDQAQRQ